MPSRKKQKPFAVIDCETDPFKSGRLPEPFIWGFYDGSSYYTCDNSDDLVNRIMDFDGFIYAHNGGRFDFHFIIKHLAPYSEPRIINGRLAEIEIGNAKLRDSWLILPTSLGTYNKTVIDYGKMEREVRHDHMREIKKYLKDDCVFLYQLIETFKREFGDGLTLAGAAIKYWGETFDQEIPKSSKTFFETMSPFYYGGRVECFTKGVINETVEVYDINSAYPHAMCSNHPWGTSYVSTSTLPRNNVELCFIELSCHSDGAFPLRDPKTKKLEFPCGHGTYQVTGHEYVAATELGLLSDVKIIRVLNFTHMITFKDYVQHFFKLRQQAKADGDKGKDIVYKLAMNSLYGKLAANPLNYNVFDNIPPDKIAGALAEGWEFAGDLSHFALVRKPLDESRMHFYNVATAASITGSVRAKLLRAIRSVSKPVYCDTDSIICHGAGDLHISDSLGDWKFEGLYHKGAVAGKKLYAFVNNETGDEKKASKGVKLTTNEIFDVASGKVVEYVSQVPTYSALKTPYFSKRNVRIT